MYSKPLLSICTVAYNDEKYIEQMLQSVLNQKVNFSYELLIHDDASTDKTPIIIKKYQEKYPNIIKPIFQKENKFSQGIRPNMVYNLPKAQGEYLAFLEADDFWTDNNKLQQQIDFLERNKDFVACSHNTKILREIENGNKVELMNHTTKNIFTIKDFARGEIYFHTSSLVFRFNSDIKKKTIKYMQKYYGDYFRLILFSTLGSINYIDKIMSVYRIHKKGVWSSLTKEQQMLEKQDILIKSYNFFDIKYRNYFLEHFLKNMEIGYINRDNKDFIKILLKNETKNSLLEKIFRTINIKNTNSDITFSKKLNLLYNKLESFQEYKENFILYGAGTGMDLVSGKLNKSKILFTIDKDENKHNSIKNDIKIVSLSNFTKYDDNKTKIIITVFGREEEISNLLLNSYNVEKDRLILLGLTL